MSRNIQIREATINDLTLLCKISKETFVETYGSQNTTENLQTYLIEHFSKAIILAEIQAVGTTFLLLFLEEEIVGYAKLRINNAEFSDRNALELERIYVKNAFHGNKLGVLLIQECIEKTKALGCDLLWLGVWEYNSKAISFYNHMGFERCGSHIFYLGDDAQTDYLMKKELNIQSV